MNGIFTRLQGYCRLQLLQWSEYSLHHGSELNSDGLIFAMHRQTFESNQLYNIYYVYLASSSAEVKVCLGVVLIIFPNPCIVEVKQCSLTDIVEVIVQCSLTLNYVEGTELIFLHISIRLSILMKYHYVKVHNLNPENIIIKVIDRYIVC